jgi:hypothetical protein
MPSLVFNKYHLFWYLNKYHLFKWKIVKRPYVEGGLQVRDPELANLALGGKIIWNLYANHTTDIQ